MRWIAAGAVLALAACHHRGARPLREAILGSWDEICAIEDEHASRCPGKDDGPVRRTFSPDGTLELTMPRVGGPSESGTWRLDGDLLDVRFRDRGGSAASFRYRARIDGDQLVLWDLRRDFGTILARPGAHVETAPLAVAAGGARSGEIDDVRYTIDLPTGYALTHDLAYQRWSPPGDGLFVELMIEPAIDCVPGNVGLAESRKKIDGVDRERGIAIRRCLGGDRQLSCAVEHTRGYLEPGEHDDALALCRHLSID